MDNGTDSYHRFLNGDKEGMVQIILNYKDGLTLYLCKITNNISLAEELMEDTFVQLYVKKPRFSGKSSFRTWLYAIGRNLTLNTLRRRKWISDRSVEEYTDFSNQEDIEKLYIRKEQNTHVYRTMRKLRSEYRQVLYLVFFEEFSNEETAQIMHKSKRQIEMLIYRAKKSLRLELEKEGFSYEE